MFYGEKIFEKVRCFAIFLKLRMPLFDGLPFQLCVQISFLSSFLESFFIAHCLLAQPPSGVFSISPLSLL